MSYSDYDAYCDWLKEQADAKRELAEVTTKPRTCAWSRVAPGDDLCASHIWSGSCGVEWAFDDDETPAENEMNYCPRCGAKLETQQPKEST